MIDCKIIALDLDGTVLQEGGWLSEATKRAIELAISAGYHVVPTTGRTLSEIPDEIRAIPGIRFAIVSNGASVMDLENDEEIFSDLIPLSVAKEVFDVLYSHNIVFQAYSEGVSFGDERYMKEIVSYFGAGGMNYSWLAERIRFVNHLPSYFEKADRHVEKIAINRVTPEEYDILQKTFAEVPSITVTSSDSRNMEINSVTANKGAALMQLCTGLGIPPEQSMAIGDGNNDIEMLAAAGFSVAMGNAAPGAKQVASYVTVSNNDDGVAVAFRKFLGIE